jgi:hypothetical protein
MQADNYKTLYEINSVVDSYPEWGMNTKGLGRARSDFLMEA